MYAQREFVVAARSIGAPNRRILFREILPNIVPTLLSFALTGLALLLVAEGALASLGLSVEAPLPTWGRMISSGQERLRNGHLVAVSHAGVGDVPDHPRDQPVGRRAGRAVQHARGHRMSAKLQVELRGREGPLLEVTDLHTHFKTARGLVRSVDGVSFTLDRGAALGIVGESGSGKTVLSRSIMGLLPKRNTVKSGSVVFEGRELINMSLRQRQSIWGKEMSMIFQDPMTSLNPVMRDRQADRRGAADPPRHVEGRRPGHGAEAAAGRAASPSPDRRLDQYPFELSGGMRQRVMIAMAMSCGPTLLFADEPTTALDVTVQAQILDLLGEQRRERNMSLILVTHDLGVVAGHTDEIAVMYGGKLVEKATTAELFANMKMPYTEALLQSIPKLTDPSHTRLNVIAGSATRSRQPATRLPVRAAVPVRPASAAGGGATADPHSRGSHATSTRAGTPSAHPSTTRPRRGDRLRQRH